MSSDATPDPYDSPVAFGQRLRILRTRRGMTRVQMGGLLGGKSASWVRALEEGRLKVPRLVVVRRIAEVLRVRDLAELTGDQSMHVDLFSGPGHPRLAAVRAAVDAFPLPADEEAPPAEHLRARLAPAWAAAGTGQEARRGARLHRAGAEGLTPTAPSGRAPPVAAGRAPPYEVGEGDADRVGNEVESVERCRLMTLLDAVVRGPIEADSVRHRLLGEVPVESCRADLLADLWPCCEDVVRRWGGAWHRPALTNQVRKDRRPEPTERVTSGATSVGICGLDVAPRREKALQSRSTGGPNQAFTCCFSLWARTVSNRRHLLCKSSALPLSYAPVE